MHSTDALEKCLTLPNIHKVLDIGVGKGDHARRFRQSGYVVHTVDNNEKYNADYQDISEVPDGNYDLVWCSHTLEHAPNIDHFLKALISKARINAYICITVPPAKNEIVGGHINLFNGGLLLYRMVLAGLDCRGVQIKQYGYNISLLVQHRPVVLPTLAHDCGDIETLSMYMPSPYRRQGYDGNIINYNW